MLIYETLEVREQYSSVIAIFLYQYICTDLGILALNMSVIYTSLDILWHLCAFLKALYFGLLSR